MRHLIAVIITAAAVLTPRPAAAWGFEVHRYITDRAIALLPVEIRPFFEKFRTVVVEHSIDPDLWRTAGWEEEPPRHFVDMDAYGPHPFTEIPRDFDEAVRRYGREFVLKNGTLPWRTQEMHDKLVEAFTQKAPYARENIKFFASVISHYVADGHVPFHSALNYDGQLTGQNGIHSRFETELFERYQASLRVNPRAIVPITKSARDTMFDVLITSFPMVQPILDADKAAIKGREVYDDEYFKRFLQQTQPVLERRLADSIVMAASMITEAWQKAGRPALPVDAPRLPRKVRR
jgi:Zinc dependent phospholipase C